MNIEKQIDNSVWDSVYHSVRDSVHRSVTDSVTFDTRADVVRRVHRLVGFDIVDMLHDEMTAHGINDSQLSLPAT